MPSPRTFFPALLSIALAVAGSAQAKFSNGTHEDASIGFRVKVPDKWTPLPVDSSEKWVVGTYVAANERVGKTKEIPYRAHLRIMSFPGHKGGAEPAESPKGGDESKPQTNYKDWFVDGLKSSGLSYVADSEKTESLADGPVTKLEFVTPRTGEKDSVLKYLCWVYQRKADGTTVALEFSQLSDHFKSDVGDFEQSLKTFKFLTPTTVSIATPGTNEKPLWLSDRAAWQAMQKAARHKVREQLEAQQRQAIASSPPADWEVATAKRFVVLSHSNPKYNALVLDVAEATWDWLDKRFGDLSDDYVMAGTIRICRDKAEFDSYLKGVNEGDSFNTKSVEVVDFRDEDLGAAGGQLGLIGGLANNYFYGKDPHACAFVPTWLSTGLANYLSSGEVAGKRLVFKSANREKAIIREVTRDKAARTFFDLIHTAGDDMPRDRQLAERMAAQLGSLIRFLESKDAERIKPLAKFMSRYLVATVKAGEQWKTQNPDVEKEVKTGAEAEEQAKAEAKKNKEMRRFILDTVNKEVAGFAQKDWLVIEAAWKAWLSK